MKLHLRCKRHLTQLALGVDVEWVRRETLYIYLEAYIGPWKIELRIDIPKGGKQNG